MSELTPKQIKFFKSWPFELSSWIFLAGPCVAILAFIFFYFFGRPLYSSEFIMQIFSIFVVFTPVCLFFAPKYTKIYHGIFDILESEQNFTLAQAIKLSIKRSFCSHLGYEATIEENPSPLHFLNIKAKCSDCGAQNYEINKKAHEDYKLNLADSVLFQRNREKFPEFYDEKLAHWIDRK